MTTDVFDTFAKAQRARFDEAQKSPLFQLGVGSELIWRLFIEGLAPELRQHYACNCCRHFVQRFGNLVTVDANGIVTSAVWPDASEVPARYARSMQLIHGAIQAAEISDMFAPSKRKMGTPVSGVGPFNVPWTHMACYYDGQIQRDPANWQSERRADRAGLDRSLSYTSAHLNEAVTLLESGSLYRASVYLNHVKSLKVLAPSPLCNNQKWFLVASKGTGFCRLHNTPAGILLQRIKEGADFTSIQREWNAVMASANYGRSQTAPKAGNLQAANKLFEDFGIRSAMQRRFAEFQDLASIIWSKPSNSSGFFSTIEGRAPASTPSNLPPQTMTWVKFRRTLLGKAKSIQIKPQSNRHMALVTAVDPYAPPILKWGNPVSWYYAGGGDDGEMARRVKAAGGKYDNCDIRFSLMWQCRNDLDLHASSPLSNHIYFGDKKGRCGGYLDVDMNVHGETSEPVENIRWSSAQNGRYCCWVNNYKAHGKWLNPTPFTMEIAVGSKTFHVSGSVRGSGVSSGVNIVSFNYNGGEISQVKWGSGVTIESQASPSLYREVSAILPSPDQWAWPDSATHFFFLTKETAPPQPSKLFLPNMLIGDLHPHRRVMEAYTSVTRVALAPSPSAGYGFNAERDWNLDLLVDGRPIRIDRFD